MSRVVHLGLGSFHRAHQAVYTQAANRVTGSDRRITGVSLRNRELVAALRAQRGRYTVLEVGPDAAAPLTVEVVDEVLLAADQPVAVVAALADEATTTVTLTVTEKGYAFRPGGHDLDLTDPGIRRDATLEAPPTTAVGLLAAGLLARADHGAPVDLVSCDNVGHNGAALRAVLEQYAALLPPREGAAVRTVLDAAGTPDTMVDRIVPRTTEATRRAVAAAGISDAVPVPAEPFSMWVLDASGFTAPRPAWESAGAVLSGEVGAYELVKLRLLNAPNSMLAYLGLLTGRTEIADAAADPDLRALADRALGDEMEPTIPLPAGFDAAAYRAQVFRRFLNHDLRHLTEQVGSDGSLKLTQRVPAAVAWHTARGSVPEHLALLVAAWLRVTADADAVTIPTIGLHEPVRDRVRSLAAAARGPHDLAHAALVDAALLGHDLTTRTSFVDRVGELLADLRRHPAAALIRSMARSTPALTA
ncbi:mannitol dehydrogenase family protein [Lapillicoccus jejuensis]|uniref:Fructuronate reductase n=1 Tax=Lapillicoccus jejuensis TaxID=402171 RepID=A0A542E1K9_9MICO|nr:mannitol dehydrogenase family protein [Lapillicoccus jejuensis]TQJ09222.1 fructuronate reductase [Lapillicoccus jejuensis]